METETKIKYIDITQLPVAEDENTVLTYEHFQNLREELEKPTRRYEFEGVCSIIYEIASSPKPKFRFLSSALCSPSRDYVITDWRISV